MIEQKQLIDIIKNPSKYMKDQDNFCNLINVLLVEINRLTNKLTIYQQNLLNDKYGYIQKNCIAQKANDIALFSMFSPNLLSNNKERFINLINRYIEITGLLNYNMPLNNSGYPGSGYPGSGYPGSGYPGYGSGYPGSGYPASGYPGYGSGYPASGYPGYGYPGYGYPGYGYPGYGSGYPGSGYPADNVSHSRIYSPQRVDFVSNQTGGESYSQRTIKNFNTKNLEEAKLTSPTLSINFVDSENTLEIDGNKFFARGGSTAIYKIKIKTTLNNLDTDEVLIMRLIQQNEDKIESYLKEFIDKYQSDLNISINTKKYFIDVLIYGNIKKNGKNFAYFIVPNYNTDRLLLNNFSSIEKKKSLINTIKMLQLFNNNNKFIDDLKIANISIDNNLEPVLIDYDINTIQDRPSDIFGEYKYSYYNEAANRYKTDKIYHILLSQMIYQFYYLGEYKNFEKIKETFDNLFTDKVGSLKISKVPDLSIFHELNEKSVFIGQDKLLYDETTGKGLLCDKYDNILSLDEVLLKLKNIMDKPTLNTIFSDNSVAKFKKYISDDSPFFISKWGIGIKNFENPNLYKFQLDPQIFDKLRLNHYYFRKNKWDIQYYENDKDTKITNETLRYALQSVGCIHTVSFEGINKPPVYILHLNQDFKNKYGGYFDNCRVIEEQLWTLIFWIVEITNLFNIISANYHLNKTIYLNIHDNPINKGVHPIGTNINNHPYPNFNLHSEEIKIPITSTPSDIIYCWAPKKEYKDVGLPFPDIWMHLFSYWFSNDFNIDNFSSNEFVKKTLNEKIGQAFFRGSYTNCSYPIKDSVRLISHLKTLQKRESNKEGLINSYVVGGLTTFNYQHFDSTKLRNSDVPIEYWLKEDKYYPAKNQPEFRYILNLDGFASAWRIVKEMYYNSILIIPESPFNDIIRDILKPWKHYIPVKGDLSNLENTIKWCNDNLDKMNIILGNIRRIRDRIITSDNMFKLTFNKISTNDNTLSLNLKLTDSELGDYKESEDNLIVIPLIYPDDIKKLGKQTKFEWIDANNNLKRSEDIYYKKYLKYKKKYLLLSNK